ncbi:MAG: hypothetical protein QM786_05565 [Breznakibacter sp.]
MPKSKKSDPILTLLTGKAGLKQHVFDNTFEVFKSLKQVLSEIADRYNKLLEGSDPRIRLEYHDKGEFVALLRVAGDTLVFYMHSNTFEFDRDHKVWQIPYVQQNLVNSYVGQIHIFNFLSDSFRYNRNTDVGYLVARLFVNQENHFFVEGKRQKGMSLANFGQSVIDGAKLVRIVETAILYSLQFDLLVPPYENVSIITLEQVNEEIMNSRMKTGKRLGFQYNSDDVKG